MKIHPNHVQRAPEVVAGAPVRAKRSEKTARPAPAAELALSDTARDLQAARQKLAELPDVREDRIEELRRDIAADRYRVAGRKVAEKLVRHRLDFRV